MSVAIAVTVRPFPSLNAQRPAPVASDTPDSEGQANATSSATPEQRDEDKQKQIEQLQRRDREVRAHEAAHKAAAGSLGGAIHYDLKTGPDGKRYAVAGDVSIDSAAIRGDPHASLAKANRIRSAALAPVDPSSQDRAVAARANAMAMQALKDINAARQNEHREQKTENNSPERGPLLQQRAQSSYQHIQGSSQKSHAALHLVV